MSDWSAGYVADIGYTFGYYTELNPTRIKLAFLNNGLVFPEVGTACELGFGQGLSANIHAAASVTHWYGTDFNPSQAAFGQELAETAGINAKLFDEAFADFANRSDLPDFDFIGLHGIWSWISDENRSLIVDFIRRKLKVGGVLYVSYNTLPGWAAFAPMRHLMTEHAEIIGSAGRGIVSRIDDAIDFADKLLATNPIFSRANPLVGERIKSLKTQNRHYLAHEYFNRDWHPMHFANMAEWLEPAKLQYACSAHYLDQIDAINLTADQQLFLQEIPDPMFRQSVYDFMVNQQFRRDYWVKGLRKLTSLEHSEQLGAQRVMLVSHRSKITLQVTGALGKADMSADVYNPVLDLLSDHKPRTLSQISSSLKSAAVTHQQLVQAVMILIGAGHLSAVQDDAITAKARKQTERLNAYIINKSRGTGEINYLASPVTGGGVNLTRFQQLFVLSITRGKKLPSELAQVTWDALCFQGEKLIKEGNVLETPEENLQELTRQATEFLELTFPLLKGLQIV